MGFSLQIGPASGVFEPSYAAEVEAGLRRAVGESVPLGSEDEVVWLTGDTPIGEMGWDWWDQMQRMVLERLGPERSRHACGVRAWCGVYIDARVGPGVLDGGHIRSGSKPARASVLKRWTEKWREHRAIRRGDTKVLIGQMVDGLASAQSDRGLVQVADLRALRAELGEALSAFGHEPDDGAMGTLIAGYYGPDHDRCDEDTGLQCLAHAWVATSKALELGAPLWLVK